MSDIAPTLDEVHRTLLDRIVSGAYPVGSKLPSCRALAADLNSNSTTVDRAISRLAHRGRVRTVPRRGTYVVDSGEGASDARDVVRAQLDEVLLRARRLGLTREELDELLAGARDRVDQMRRIALVECNDRDMRRLQEIVQAAGRVEVQPVLLCDAVGRRLDEEFDAVAVPVFHLNDVAALVGDMDAVIELPLVTSPTALRRLISLRDLERVVVVAPTARGVQWMTAIVGQYYPGEIDGFVIGTDDPELLAEAPAVVVNNAANVPAALENQLHRVIAIEWELDHRFAAGLAGRIDAVIDSRRTPRLEAS
ncbi:MAG: GntR family transcriptional regulator [Nocardioides sp.]|uniref:GntR family transcriptional regulator n=1 Tax=Nocardioides sp. TaxID=35761 RepID=UPI003F02AF98